MKSNGALQKVLRSYRQYYSIKEEQVLPPFAAEAEFHSHSEQYFLVKAAKIADIDSHEYVFFAEEDTLTAERLAQLDAAAWNGGISRVCPYSGHRNSDVTLVVLAQHIEDDALSCVKRLRHSKSYRFGLWGWSDYRAIAYEIPSGRCAANRLGRGLKDVVCIT